MSADTVVYVGLAVGGVAGLWFLTRATIRSLGIFMRNLWPH